MEQPLFTLGNGNKTAVGADIAHPDPEFPQLAFFFSKESRQTLQFPLLLLQLSFQAVHLIPGRFPGKMHRHKKQYKTAKKPHKTTL
jgi:hypothetical protein